MFSNIRVSNLSVFFFSILLLLSMLGCSADFGALETDVQVISDTALYSGGAISNESTSNAIISGGNIGSIGSITGTFTVDEDKVISPNETTAETTMVHFQNVESVIETLTASGHYTVQDLNGNLANQNLGSGIFDSASNVFFLDGIFNFNGNEYVETKEDETGTTTSRLTAAILNNHGDFIINENSSITTISEEASVTPSANNIIWNIDGDIVVGNNSTITGIFFTDQNAIIGDNVTVNGRIFADGNIRVGENYVQNVIPFDLASEEATPPTEETEVESEEATLVPTLPRTGFGAFNVFLPYIMLFSVAMVIAFVFRKKFLK